MKSESKTQNNETRGNETMRTLKATDRIYSAVHKTKRQTLRFNCVLVSIEVNDQGNYYITYRPVGGEDYSHCGMWGTATVDAAGNPINWRTQQSSDWGMTLRRTDRFHVEPKLWYPKPGNTAYDLMC